MENRNLTELKAELDLWRSSLCKSIDLNSLHARSEVAHKWKAPFRCLVLRETVFWRTEDLLRQSVSLYENGGILGARILLRSALETIAVLIYSSQRIAALTAGLEEYSSFEERTKKLLLGSRDGSTSYQTVNIMTVLEKCSANYPFILNLYAELSESAHPNCDGLMHGYSRVDRANITTEFFNRWGELFSESHVVLLDMAMLIFRHEYDVIWPKRLEELENFLIKNDAKLEKERASAGR